MRVLHIYKGYPPILGGIEGHVATVARGQARRGHQVTVLTTRPGGLGTRTTIEDGVEVIRAGAPMTARSTPLAPTLATSFLRARRQVDVVHVHLPFPPGELLGLLPGRKPILIASYHSDIVKQRWIGALWRPWQRRLLVRADRVLVASHAYRARSRQLVAPARTAIVPYGIDLQRFEPDTEPTRAAAARWRERFAGPIVLFVGRLRYYKGIEHLIDAASRIADAQVLIVGSGPEGERLRRRAAAGSAASRIHFLGDISDDELPALYAAADVFVLPSTQPSEAFGIVLVEAMAAGTPVISTEIGTGTSEINVDGHTGIVVPRADSEALARAIDDVLQDADRRRALGEAAREHARAHFDQESMIDRIIDHYRRARPSSASGAPVHRGKAARRIPPSGRR